MLEIAPQLPTMSLRGGTTKQSRSCADPLCIACDCRAIARNDIVGRHTQRLIQYRNIKCLTKP